MTTAGKTVLPDFYALHTLISKQQRDVLFSVNIKPTKTMATVHCFGAGDTALTASKVHNYFLQKKRKTVKAVPLRVAFITYKTGITKNIKKPRSCQPAAPKNEVSKEVTQSFSN